MLARSERRGHNLARGGNKGGLSGEDDPEAVIPFVDEAAKLDAILGRNQPKAGATTHTAQTGSWLKWLVDIRQPSHLRWIYIKGHLVWRGYTGWRFTT